MKELRYTLLSDGPSDKALMPILDWLLQQNLPNLPIQPRWADLGRLPKPPKELPERIQAAMDLYPCDLLFVHRDAETVTLNDRLNEISEAVAKANAVKRVPPTVGVVPVRMTEAWLLFDTEALRQAAGNPNGTVELDMPRLSDLEGVPDPKKRLHELLRVATELRASRRRRFDTNVAVQRIPKYVEDFSPLRSLSAFLALEGEVKKTIESHTWHDLA